MKRRELALLRNPQLKYLPPYILKDTESFFAKYEKMAPEKRQQVMGGFRMLQEFVRKFVAAGGKIHSGSDPNHVVPGYAVHAELQMLIEAGLTPEQAVRTASLNVAEAWGKQKDFGSVEAGKVADLILVSGDPLKNISDTQNVEMVFSEGKKIDTTLSRRLQKSAAAADRRSAGAMRRAIERSFQVLVWMMCHVQFGLCTTKDTKITKFGILIVRNVRDLRGESLFTVSRDAS